VVLSDDPFTIAQDKIKDLQIVRTVVAGSPVFHA
jgi:predicted amidohydrolase YtcJ